MSGVAYADTSTLVKLVLVEAETPAVYRWFTESTRVMTSRVGVIETVRASSRRPHDPAHLAFVLADLQVIELDVSVASVAASIGSPVLRTWTRSTSPQRWLSQRTWRRS